MLFLCCRIGNMNTSSAHWWGHKAEKATFLYIVGCSPFDIPNLPMRLDEPTHTVSSSGRDGCSIIDGKIVP